MCCLAGSGSKDGDQRAGPQSKHPGGCLWRREDHGRIDGSRLSQQLCASVLFDKELDFDAVRASHVGRQRAEACPDMLDPWIHVSLDGPWPAAKSRGPDG